MIVENLSSRVSWQDLKVNLLFIDKDMILSCKVSWQHLKVNLLYQVSGLDSLLQGLLAGSEGYQPRVRSRSSVQSILAGSKVGNQSRVKSKTSVGSVFCQDP